LQKKWKLIIKRIQACQDDWKTIAKNTMWSFCKAILCFLGAALIVSGAVVIIIAASVVGTPAAGVAVGISIYSTIGAHAWIGATSLAGLGLIAVSASWFISSKATGYSVLKDAQQISNKVGIMLKHARIMDSELNTIISETETIKQCVNDDEYLKITTDFGLITTLEQLLEYLVEYSEQCKAVLGKVKEARNDIINAHKL